MTSAYNEVLEAEMTEHLGAQPNERTEQREGYRNGHYTRSLVTRVGPLTLRVPRTRDGSFSTKIFARYQRSEKALVVALMEMMVNGVSTRKVKRITEELCGREFSKSTVSRLAKGLDEQVEAWNERPLDGDRYPFVLVDAMHIKVCRQGAVRSTSALIAVGINEEGYREILGLRIANSETEKGWLETFRWLKGRGLEGVELVVSDAHEGLVEALRRCFQGASWQRCQTHFRRNILDKTPAEWKEAMQEGLDRVFEAEDPATAREHRGAGRGARGRGRRCARHARGRPRGRDRRPPAARQVPAPATDHQHAGAAHLGAETPGEGDPDLPQRRVRLAAARRLPGRNTRGLVDRPALLPDGRLLQLETTAAGRRGGDSAGGLNDGPPIRRETKSHNVRDLIRSKAVIATPGVV